MKYSQSAIAFNPLYERTPGAQKTGSKVHVGAPKLYGFYSDKRDRTLTGPARDVEVHPVVEPQPLGYNARKAFILARCVIPLKRDKKSKPIK